MGICSGSLGRELIVDFSSWSWQGCCESSAPQDRVLNIGQHLRSSLQPKRGRSGQVREGSLVHPTPPPPTHPTPSHPPTPPGPRKAGGDHRPFSDLSRSPACISAAMLSSCEQDWRANSPSRKVESDSLGRDSSPRKVGSSIWTVQGSRRVLNRTLPPSIRGIVRTHFDCSTNSPAETREIWTPEKGRLSILTARETKEQRLNKFGASMGYKTLLAYA